MQAVAMRAQPSTASFEWRKEATGRARWAACCGGKRQGNGFSSSACPADTPDFCPVRPMPHPIYSIYIAYHFLLFYFITVTLTVYFITVLISFPGHVFFPSD